MALTPVERMKIKNAVERILHVPGNYSGGILEMAMVFDGNLSEEYRKQIGKDIASALKSHSETFRNVRLNLILWEEDGKLEKELSSLPKLQMGRCFETCNCSKERKRMELLTEDLKKFYARSKLIMLFTDGDFYVEDKKRMDESMYPFLYRKLMAVYCSGEMKQEDSDKESKEKTGGFQVFSGMELLKM